VFEEADREAFVRQARAVGFPEGEYLEALRKVPVFEEGRIRTMMGFLVRLAEFIGEVGYARMQLDDANRALREQESRLEQLVLDRTAELSAAKDAAEMASRAKSKFLATVSHELRTPLNAVIGFSGVVLSGMPGELNDEQRRQLDIVQRAGKQLHSLISDMLVFADTAEPGAPIPSRSMSLREVLEPMIATFAAEASRRALSFSSELPEPGLVVRADPDAVRRVTAHLLANAFKFTEVGGVSLRTHAVADFAIVEIEDSGIGIAPERLPALFLPFDVHAPAARRPGNDGTGIGLAVARELVEAMGGRIEVDSTPGRGSVFRFTLPRERRR
jgi:signal transduction histidine kinase